MAFGFCRLGKGLGAIASKRALSVGCGNNTRESVFTRIGRRCCLISVGYHLELCIAITFYRVYHFLPK